MRKAYGWVTLVLMAIGCLALLLPAQARQLQPAAANLLEVMEDSGAKGLEVEVRTSLSIGQASSPEELGSLANQWANRLNTPAAHAVITKKDDRYVYRIVSNYDDIRLLFQVTGLPKKGGYQAYLVFQMKGSTTTLPYIEKIQSTAAAALKQAGLIPQFSTCIRGMYSDKMSVDQQEGKILSIFRALQAKELERLQDESVVSISGYTRAWEPFIALNDQKMNLQVATHRDTQSDGTWITVGTPIITAEY
ncbi:YwmB family TATA-box binding protein [Brevibacillus sp. H7]|jgi:hypothetical protein|uniref:YwmB family TATA-box binding protein n=1 Tax=Brevibacillus sp. H7 TaxID=3349138 RepID=UPI00380796D1